MTTWINQRELAKAMNVSEKTISEWKKRGKLKGLIRNGKVNKEKALEVLPGRVAPIQQASQNIRWGKEQKQPPPHEPDQPETEAEVKTYLDENIGELSKLDIYELQRRNELEKLLLARLKRKKEEGELIDRNLTIKQTSDAFRVCRDAILNIPDRESANLMAITDPAEFRQKLANVLRQPLDDLQRHKHVDAE